MIQLELTGRPYATKNSRRLMNGRSFMSAGATKWMKDAKTQLRQQWKHEPSDAAHIISITIYYADGRHMLDVDNASSAVLDALKGIVIKDDKPKYVPDLHVRSRQSRTGQAHVSITLEAL